MVLRAKQERFSGPERAVCHLQMITVVASGQRTQYRAAIHIQHFCRGAVLIIVEQDIQHLVSIRLPLILARIPAKVIILRPLPLGNDPWLPASGENFVQMHAR